MPKNSDDMRAPWRDTTSFGWSQRHVADAVMVDLAGELDLATAAELHQRLIKLVESGPTTMIVLDLSGVEFIDACTIRVLQEAWVAGQRRGRELQVDGLRGLPATVFNVLGLEWMLVRRRAHDRAKGHANA